MICPEEKRPSDPPPARDLLGEKEAFEERLAICLADGMSEEEAMKVADKQLWDTIRAAEKRQAEK